MQGNTSKRNESKERTRKALIHAAGELFRDQGLDGPSLDAICSKAGYTRGAFYVHFRDRDDLVAAVMERVLRNLINAVIAREEEDRDLETTIERYVGIAGLVMSQPEGPDGILLSQLLDACRRSEGVRKSFVSVLEEAMRGVARAATDGQRAGRVREDLTTEELGLLLVILALGLRTGAEIGLPVDLVQARLAAFRLVAPTQDGD